MMKGLDNNIRPYIGFDAGEGSDHSQVIIVGAGVGVGSDTVISNKAIMEMEEKGVEVVFLDGFRTPHIDNPIILANSFMVNGKRYIEREECSNRYPRFSSVMTRLLVDTAINQVNRCGAVGQPVECDIIKEFGLIKQKKSNLTASQREWVVYQFNKLYEEVIYATIK